MPKFFKAFSSILFLVIFSTSFSNNYTPQNIYNEPKEIQNVIKPVNVNFNTPAFKGNRNSFTTQEEMMSFLRNSDAANSNLKLEIMEYSQGGKEIPVLIFASGGIYDKNKLTIWIQAQMHGNEPAAGEALLALISQLADGEYGNNILNSANLIIVPRLNPDGSEEFIKFTRSGKDVNADYVKLSLPETKAAVLTFNRFKPHVAIDLHEYVAVFERFKTLGSNGALPYYDIQITSATTPNRSSELDALADNLLIPRAKESLKQKGYTQSWYFNDVIPKNSGNNFTLIMADSHSNIGRNYYGLSPAVSVLVEARGGGLGWQNFPRRVDSLLTVVKSMINSSVSNSSTIKSAVVQASKGFSRDIVTDKPSFHSDEYIFIDLATINPQYFTVSVQDTKHSTPGIVRDIPQYYVVVCDDSDIKYILNTHRIQYQQLNQPQSLTVESYRRIKDNQRTAFVLEPVTKTFPVGTYIIPMDQPKARFIPVLMEPESPHSLAAYGIVHWNGSELGVYRYNK